jgi:hypothetical protein
MKKTIIPIALLSLALSSSSCGGKKEEKGSEEVTKTDSTQTAKEETPKTEENSLADPYKSELSKVAISAQKGDKCLASTDIFNSGNAGSKIADINITFVNKEIEEAGTEFTKIKNFGGGTDNVPNYFVVPIKPGQTAKKGDIVVGPWHHGGSMNRAIVIDDKDPAKPLVNFIDINWTNPAKGDKGVGFGQEQVQLEANSFNVLTSPFQSGTSVAFKEGNDWKLGFVYNVCGDKILLSGFADKHQVVNKADCKALEIQPTCKVGDEVMVSKYGTFRKLKVEKIDSKFGRIYFESTNPEKATIVPFGTTTATL